MPQVPTTHTNNVMQKQSQNYKPYSKTKDTKSQTGYYKAKNSKQISRNSGKIPFIQRTPTPISTFSEIQSKRKHHHFKKHTLTNTSHH